jgi:hypothetical protein
VLLGLFCRREIFCSPAQFFLKSSPPLLSVARPLGRVPLPAVHFGSLGVAHFREAFSFLL